MSIRKLLKQYGIIDIVHEKTGASKSYLFGIRAGKNNPTIRMFCKICIAAGANPVEVFEETVKELVQEIKLEMEREKK